MKYQIFVKRIRRFVSSSKGATLLECALTISALSMICITAVQSVGVQVSDSMMRVSSEQSLGPDVLAIQGLGTPGCRGCPGLVNRGGGTERTIGPGVPGFTADIIPDTQQLNYF